MGCMVFGSLLDSSGQQLKRGPLILVLGYCEVAFGSCGKHCRSTLSFSYQCLELQITAADYDVLCVGDPDECLFRSNHG